MRIKKDGWLHYLRTQGFGGLAIYLAAKYWRF